MFLSKKIDTVLSEHPRFQKYIPLIKRNGISNMYDVFKLIMRGDLLSSVQNLINIEDRFELLILLLKKNNQWVLRRAMLFSGILILLLLFLFSLIIFN